MSDDSSPNPYRALALQVTCRAVNRLDRDGARQRYAETLARLRPQVAASKAFIGNDLRLVVLPEYFLSGFPMGESLSAWRDKAAIALDGPEIETMAAMASDLGVHLSGNAYEADPNFPDLYFQTSFLLDDSGDLVLRYRRLNSMYAPTPHDVWERYLDLYGLEAVFPVADTALGRLAAIASEEILFPELARCLAMRGAEVFLHSSSEVAGRGETPKDLAKRCRAIENLAYVVSANSAGIEGTAIPAASTDGGSKIIDHRGLILAQASPGESMVAQAAIDVAALRHERRRPGMGNLFARNRFELYADSYRDHSVHPVDSLAEGTAERDRLRRAHEDAIQRLVDAGLI